MRCPSDIVEHQMHMDGVDMGDQHRAMGAGFANVVHLNDSTRKYSYGLWILAFYKLIPHGIYLLKRNFYAVVVDNETSAVLSNMSCPLSDRQPHPTIKYFNKNHPHYSMISMEEPLMNKVVGSIKTKGIQKYHILHIAQTIIVK